MLYDEFSDCNVGKIKEPKLEDNQIFTENVFNSIFRSTRMHLKIRALEIRKNFQLNNIDNPTIISNKIKEIMYEINTMRVFDTLGEKIFFELHLIFGGDTEFSNDLKKYNRDYNKMAKEYNTKPNYVKMRNIIRLLNNKEKLNEITKEELDKNLDDIINGHKIRRG